MKYYSSVVQDGAVEALLLIEAREAARWQDASMAVNAAITQYAEEKKLGRLLFPRVLEFDAQEDGAIMFRFEAAVKPEVRLGAYKGLHTGVPRAEKDRFAQKALDLAAENTSVTIPALIVERRLEQMVMQRRGDMLQSAAYKTLADIYAILTSCNEELEIPRSPEDIWAMAMNAASKINSGESPPDADHLLSLLTESLFSENFGERELRCVANALEQRVRQKQDMDAETAADELFQLYLRSRKQSLEDWRKEHRDVAAELARTELMLDAVAERENLSVSREEFEHELSVLSTRVGIGPNQVLSLTGEETLCFQLLRAKARDLIVQSALE